RLAGRIERHDLAVVAAGNEPRAVARARHDAAVMDGDALFRCAFGRQQHRFLAEHESRNVFEEMRADHTGAGLDGARALDDGRSVARFAHEYTPTIENVGGHARPSARLAHPTAALLRHTGLEALADHLLGQFAADEYDPALALLAVRPRA